MRYWLGVVSKEHVLRGVQGSFAQVCHGKKGPSTPIRERISSLNHNSTRSS